MTAREYNFDGIIGPTHNYAGLGMGNLASQSHKSMTSNPREAALEGLAKMALLMRLGIPQAVLPPQLRPNISLLKRLGFSGGDAQILWQASQQAPDLLAAASSSSSMWTANAATVGPSSDSSDGRVHFTPANLATSLHRATETDTTANVLKSIFHDESQFAHHPALPRSSDMGDEGAANHSRFCNSLNDPGVQMFVCGSGGSASIHSTPRKHIARQSLRASQSIARLHELDSSKVIFAQQNPDAIDAGVFHNDVIAVGHRNLLLCHEQSFVNQLDIYQKLRESTDNFIQIIEVTNQKLSLTDAVSTYLFNSQLVSTPQGQTVLIAPDSCDRHSGVRELVATWIDQKTIDAVHYVDVSQSMSNGGGPACLRLRVVLTPEQEQSIAPGVILNEPLLTTLQQWVEKHYRESLNADDLADPKLLDESRNALNELANILGLEASSQ